MAYNPANANGQATMANSAPVVVASNQSDIPINVDKVGGTGLTLGQANATLSVPVVLPSAQITTLTPPAAITNYANETGGNLAAAKADLDTIAGAISASKMQVSGTFWQTTQPVSLTTLSTVVNLAQIAGVAPSFNGTDLNINIDKIGGFGTHGISDSDGNPSATIQVESFDMNFNGSTWDRIRSLANYPSGVGSGVSGLGVQMASSLGQYNSSLPTATSGLFYVPQLTAKAQMMMVMMDAAGNARGANVNSSNQLSVSVDNFGPASIAVTQSGAWNVGLTSSTVTLNVNVQNTVPVTGTFFQATQPVSLTTLTTVSNIVQFGGSAPTYTGGSLNVDVTNTVPVSQSGTWNIGSSSNSALADGTANPTTNLFGSLNEVFNGTTWDRVRSISAYNTGSGASGAGLLASVMLGQYNTSLPSANNGFYYVPQLTAKGQQMMVNMDAAGNNRGANVNASNQLSVSVDNTPAVSQSGAWTVGSNSATGSAVPANAFFNGARAQNAEATADTNGQLVGLAADLVGKLIVMPYANKENFISGLANTSTTNSIQVVAAQAAGLKIYVTGFSIANTGATNTLVTFQNGSGASLPIWTTIAPTTGGSNYQFLTPIATSAATGLFAQAASSTANLYISVNGYIGT